MTNTNLLNTIIANSGLKKGHLASILGITAASLWQKISNKREFKASEIQILCTALGITSVREKDRIFFAQKSELNSPS